MCPPSGPGDVLGRCGRRISRPETGALRRRIRRRRINEIVKATPHSRRTGSSPTGSATSSSRRTTLTTHREPHSKGSGRGA
jgi:hypothetical protein